VSSGRIVQGPRNTVVVSGTTTTLTCETTNLTGLCWEQLQPVNVGPGRTLLCNTNTCRHPRYSVQTSVENRFVRHSFMIDSCNGTDAGRYTCDECSVSHYKEAQLVVIGIVCTLLLPPPERGLKYCEFMMNVCLGV